MARQVEHPTVRADAGPLGGEIETHPAYAQIVAHRVSGSTHLYGSDLEHQHYVTIRVAPSERHRQLSEDWHHAPVTPMLEVALSEAQWATFVSSLNVGSGVPCTVTWRDGPVPGLPAPRSRREQFKVEALKTGEKALARLRELRERIAGGEMAKGLRDALLGKVAAAEQAVSSNLPFVADQFERHMEDVAEKAKMEVNAYATATALRLGRGDSEPVALEDRAGEE